MADETENTPPAPETTEPTETAEKAEETIEEQVAELKEEAAQAVREAASAIERFFDVTLGTGALVAEKLDANLRRIWDDTPGVVAELEERGRPIRQQLSDALKGKLPTASDAFKAGGAAETAPEDEIEALENRVKELEQQVGDPSAEKTTDEKSPFSMLELDESAPKGRKPKKSEPTEKKPEEPASE